MYNDSNYYNAMQANSFQVALVTDSNESYVIFIYGDLQWSSNTTIIGFNAGNGENFLNFLLTNSSPGVYFFRVDQEVILQQGGM